MQGHVARKRDRYYAVIYEGLDPIDGKEKRSWTAAGTDRAEAEALTARLAAERDGLVDVAAMGTSTSPVAPGWPPTPRFVAEQT